MIRPLVADLVARWFAVGGGMAAYAVVLIGGFWLVPAACGGSRWGLHLLMAGGMAVAVASLLVAWRQWRAAPPPPPPAGPPDGGAGATVHLAGVLLRRAWLAVAGLVLSAARSRAAGDGDGDGGGAASEPVAVQRRRDMAQVGVVLGALATLLIAFHWLPVALLRTCA